MTANRPAEYGDRWFFVVFAVIIVTLFLAKYARADEAPTSGPSSAPAVEVVPLPAGAVAPWDGLLVPESIFIGYMRQEIRITELTLKLEMRDRLLAEKPVVTKSPPTVGVAWSFLLGMGAGVVIAGVVVYGAVAVLKAMP